VEHLRGVTALRVLLPEAQVAVAQVADREVLQVVLRVAPARPEAVAAEDKRELLVL